MKRPAAIDTPSQTLHALRQLRIISLGRCLHYGDLPENNILAVTNSAMFELPKQDLDDCWAVHAYSNFLRPQFYMTGIE